jgi:hypothetical protein
MAFENEKQPLDNNEEHQQSIGDAFYEDLKAAGFKIFDYTQDEYELLMSRAEVEQEERKYMGGHPDYVEEQDMARAEARDGVSADGREEQGFTKQGDSYVISNDQTKATITPREGFFDVEAHRNEYDSTETFVGYVGDNALAFYGKEGYVERSTNEYWDSRELTVENVKIVLEKFEIDLPDSLAKGLSDWQEQFWDGHETEKGYIPEGAEAPEETSERLRLELGSALAEAQGIAEYESLTPSLSEDHAREQSVEVEDGEGNSFSL